MVPTAKQQSYCNVFKYNIQLINEQYHVSKLWGGGGEIVNYGGGGGVSKLWGEWVNYGGGGGGSNPHRNHAYTHHTPYTHTHTHTHTHTIHTPYTHHTRTIHTPYTHHTHTIHTPYTHLTHTTTLHAHTLHPSVCGTVEKDWLNVCVTLVTCWRRHMIHITDGPMYYYFWCTCSFIISLNMKTVDNN